MNQVIPTQWSELLASLDAAFYREFMEGLPDLVQALPETLLLAAVLPGRADLLIPYGLKEGPKAALDVVELESLLPASLAQLRTRGLVLDPLSATGWLTFTSAMLCFGMKNRPEVSQGEFDVTKALANVAEELDEPTSVTLAQHALAVGLTPLVSKFLGVPALEAAPEADATFGFNTQGYLLYMSAAADRGLESSAVRPAFVDHVNAFPKKLAARTAAWEDLMLVARAYFTLFEHQPLESVGERLFKLVRELG